MPIPGLGQAAAAAAQSGGGQGAGFLSKLLDKPGEQIGGLIQGVASLFGGGRRRREQREAQDLFDKNLAERQNFEKQNVNEGLTVNTRGARFAQQGVDQNLANAAEALQAGGDTQAINRLVQQSNQATQQASINISEQERANQLAYLEGEEDIQNFKYNQLGEDLRFSGDRLSAANAARQAATEATVKGFGTFVGAKFGGSATAGGAGGAEGGVGLEDIINLFGKNKRS